MSYIYTLLYSSLIYINLQLKKPLLVAHVSTWVIYLTYLELGRKTSTNLEENGICNYFMCNLMDVIRFVTSRCLLA